MLLTLKTIDRAIRILAFRILSGEAQREKTLTEDRAALKELRRYRATRVIFPVAKNKKGERLCSK